MIKMIRTWFSTEMYHSSVDRWLFRLAWLLHLLLLVNLFYAIARGDWPNIIGNLLAILVAFVPRWADTHSRYHFPALGEFAIALTLFVEMIGRTYHLYERISWYDSFAHAVEVGALTTFVVLLLYAFFLEHEVDYDGWFMVVAGLSIGFAIGGGWEIFEWIIDRLFQAGYQAGLDDTMIDMSVGALGALAGAFAARSYRMVHTAEEIMDEIPIFYDWL